MKDAKSCRVRLNIPAVLPLWKPGFFLHTFPINKGLMLCTLSSGLGGLLTFYDPFLIKVDQPENLFSLELFFVYTSNLCQPQKVLNRVTFSWSKGAMNYNQKTYFFLEPFFFKFMSPSESIKQSYIFTEQRCSE